MQLANFLLCGLLSLCFALGLRWTLQGGIAYRSMDPA